MIRIWTTLFSVLAGVGALASASYWYFALPDPDFWLDVAEPKVELSGTLAGEKRYVMFDFHNRSARPIRVLGCTPTCGLNACFGPKSEDEVASEINPGVTKMSFPLEARSPGKFHSQLYFWVDDHGTREIVLSVHGTAIGPPSDEKGTPKP